MARRYEDGGNLPYRVTYYARGHGTRELRFSQSGLARDEVTKLTRRGYSVNYDEWDFIGKRYITKDAYS